MVTGLVTVYCIGVEHVCLYGSGVLDFGYTWLGYGMMLDGQNGH